MLVLSFRDCEQRRATSIAMTRRDSSYLLKLPSCPRVDVSSKRCDRVNFTVVTRGKISLTFSKNYVQGKKTVY